MFKTRVTEMLGIEYPILLAPMMGITGAEMVAAAGNAGGLGILCSLSYQTMDELREEIRKTKSLTDKPFAVNVTMLPTIRPIDYEEYFNVIIEEGVNIIETSGRSPEQYMPLLKDAKVTTMHRATRTRDIKTAERIGVDIATIVGTEAAGHPGMEDVTSMVRIPIAADAVKIPIVAAGGIADARGFVAALALGAEGVLMGTRFYLTKECSAHPKIKEWLLGVGEADTIMIMRSIKNAGRAVKTDFTMKILEMEEKGATLEELLPLLSGERGRKAEETGDFSEAQMTAGQIVGLIHDVPSIKEVIDSVINEAEIIVQRLNKLGVSS